MTDDYFTTPHSSAGEPQPGTPYQPQSPAYGSVPGQGQPGWTPPDGGYSPPPASQEMNALAIVSLVLAIMGFGPVGAIIGHIARKQIRERGGRGDGLALAGVIVGWITTGLYVVLCGLAGLGAALSSSVAP